MRFVRLGGEVKKRKGWIGTGLGQKLGGWGNMKEGDMIPIGRMHESGQHMNRLVLASDINRTLGIQHVRHDFRTSRVFAFTSQTFCTFEIEVSELYSSVWDARRNPPSS